MKEESHRHNPYFWNEKHNSVNGNRIIRMKRMKSYAASVGIKYRVSQQMIQIDQHGSNHDQPGLFPFIPKEDPCQDSRKQKVHGIM